MKKFYVKLVKLAVISAAIFILIFSGVFWGIRGIYNNSYQKGFVYQYRALQRADASKPKILVLGGSYMTFAIDSKYLSELTGMPVYTLGIHSGMGMSYVFETAKEFINKDDIVIFPYSAYTPGEYGMGLIYMTLDGENDMFWSFFRAHPLEVLKSAGSEICDKLWGVLSYFKWKGKKTEGVYYASSFDKDTGNLIYKREAPTIELDSIKASINYNIEDISNNVFEDINDFNKYCKERGASLYLTFAPVLKNCMLNTKQSLATYQSELAKRFDAPIISKIEDCLMPYKYMFDGTMHLNDDGVRYYCKQLADDLKKVRKENN